VVLQGHFDLITTYIQHTILLFRIGVKVSCSNKDNKIVTLKKEDEKWENIFFENYRKFIVKVKFVTFLFGLSKAVCLQFALMYYAQ